MKGKRNTLENMLYPFLKPPRWLVTALIVLAIGSVLFKFDFFYWASKISGPYVHRVTQFVIDFFNAVMSK